MATRHVAMINVRAGTGSERDLQSCPFEFIPIYLPKIVSSPHMVRKCFYTGKYKESRSQTTEHKNIAGATNTVNLGTTLGLVTSPRSMVTLVTDNMEVNF